MAVRGAVQAIGGRTGKGRAVTRTALATLLAAVLAAVVLAPAQAAPPREAQRWALLVGVGEYQGRTQDIAGSAGDALDMREALLRAGWRADHIMTLTDGHATAANVRAGLRWLAERADDRSVSVFLYSGHVKQIGGDPDRDGEAVDEFMWPSDNKLISDAELANALRAVRGWSWTVIAGCEAAGFDDGVSGPRRLFTGSSQEPEKSYDHPGWGNSVFLGLMVDRAMLQGQADFDHNGVVSIHEAFHYAHERAPQLTKNQSKGPQHPYVAGGDGREWFLRAPAPPPDDGPTSGVCLAGICVGS